MQRRLQGAPALDKSGVALPGGSHIGIIFILQGVWLRTQLRWMQSSAVSQMLCPPTFNKLNGQWQIPGRNRNRDAALIEHLEVAGGGGG